MAKHWQAAELMARAVGGSGGGEGKARQQPGVGGAWWSGGEGFQSDLFLDVASLPQAGHERRASLDARVDVY